MAKYEVCPNCDGEGKVVNAAVSVWTESDRARDPEGFANMMAGKYDVPCPECQGLRVVTVERVEEYQQEREDHHVRLMESGVYPGSPDYY